MENSSTANPRLYSGFWVTTAYTTVFCLAIGLFLWLLNVVDSLFLACAISLCIGWSINVSFLLLMDPLSAKTSPALAPIPITAVGISAGLALSGGLMFGSPLFFFREDFGTVVLGLFFGVIGFTIMGGRSRLAHARLELEQAQAQQREQEKNLLETRLQLLQAQIEPHFLFNTLSNIIGLVRTHPEAAEQSLHNLTTLLRATLQRTRAASVTLEAELDIVRAYLEIQSLRLDSRLDYRIENELDQSQSAATHLPPLLVQPLVENAIKHGIDPLEGGGEVVVRCVPHGSRLLITISDTGVGMDPYAGSGTGLSNVRDRLRGLYGEQASLSIAPNEPNGVTITIQLPLEAT